MYVYSQKNTLKINKFIKIIIIMLYVKYLNKKNEKMYIFQKRGFCNKSSQSSNVISEIPYNSEELFKRLFGNNFLTYLNVSFLISKFFNIDFEKFSSCLKQEKSTGIDLFFRLVFNPYFNIQDQSDFDKATAFFKKNVSTFSLFGLLLVEIMNTTIGGYDGIIPKFIDCLPGHIQFFTHIKNYITTKMLVLKEHFVFSKEHIRIYDCIPTLNQMLDIIIDINAYCTQFLLQNIALIYINKCYIYNVQSPEIFRFFGAHKTYMPFSPLTLKDFEHFYFENKNIQTTFLKNRKLTDFERVENRAKKIEKERLENSAKKLIEKQEKELVANKNFSKPLSSTDNSASKCS